MEFLCKVCDPSIIETESEYKKCLATIRQKNDESVLKNILLKILTWVKLIKYRMIMSLFVIKIFFLYLVVNL